MFKELLVPLDGSPMAESALPAAAYLAEKLGARVTLMHCIERDAPEKVHGARHLSKPDEARAYLHETAHRAFPDGAQVACHTHEAAIADVPRSIIEHAEEMPSALIVLCTHGRSGLGKLLLGSIAQRILGLGATPVLLIPPARAETKADKAAGKPQGGAQAFACRRLLVPLDGREPHEEALTVAGDLSPRLRRRESISSSSSQRGGVCRTARPRSGCCSLGLLTPSWRSPGRKRRSTWPATAPACGPEAIR